MKKNLEFLKKFFLVFFLLLVICERHTICEEGFRMKEKDMTLDEIIEFWSIQCEAQKLVDNWNDDEGTDLAEESFEKYSRQSQDYDNNER